VASTTGHDGARLTALLCVVSFANTFSIGAFPALLPEIGRAGLADWQLGVLAGAMGLARMCVDVPAGLLVSRNLGRTFVVGLVALSASVLIMSLGGPYPVLVAGRVVMGAAHSLTMLSGLTAILRHGGAAKLGISLNAYELSAIIGMLGGAGLLGVLPESWPWNVALMVVCLPQVIGLALAPLVVQALPRESDRMITSGAAVSEPVAGGGQARLYRMVGSGSAAPPRATRAPVALAFAAGALMAIAYSTVEQFLIPLRGSREFGLDRTGVAHRLMIAQACDIVALLPVGMLADRLGAPRVLGGVVMMMALAAALTAFGDLWLLNVGVVCLGLAMTGWMLPLAILKQGSPAHLVGWRTALYRVGADGGMFLGPALCGALAGHHALAVPAVAAALLVALALPLLARGLPGLRSAETA
jgi:MFS family permease